MNKKINSMKNETPLFDTHLAFSRNIGWITPKEAEQLSQFTIGIAGMGGVGGHYAEILARLGVRKFHLADFDTYDIVNFNRQNGALTSNIGRPKIDVITERILEINPTAEIKSFPKGLDENNIVEFTNGIDLYCDGLDFFVLNLRELLFRKLQELSIPAITVAPVGMGAALLVFDQTSMSFDKYFGMNTTTDDEEKAIRFLLGLAPSLQHTKYLVHKESINFKQHKVSSLPMGCYLCAGVIGSIALKLLLKRGKVYKAPHSLHYDIYNNSLVHKKIWGGYKNPLQQLKFLILKKMLTT